MRVKYLNHFEIVENDIEHSLYPALVEKQASFTIFSYMCC